MSNITFTCFGSKDVIMYETNYSSNYNHQTFVESVHNVGQADLNPSPEQNYDSLCNTNSIMLMDISDTNKKLHENDDCMKLRDLLKAWNQENIANHLIAENVFIPVLKVIKRHHIERLLKNFDMGTQIMFEHNLENWRAEIEPLTNQNQVDIRSLSPFSGPPSPQTSTFRKISRESTPQRFIPYGRAATPEEYISLGSILNDSPKGFMLTEYYMKFNNFREDQRTVLVTLIASHYEEKAVQMSLSISHRLEEEILQRFPSEKLEFYRVSKRGKIYNKYCNLKASFKSTISCHVLPPKTKTKDDKCRYEKDFEPEENAEDCLRCLKYDNLTAEEFDKCWKACASYRLCEIKELPSTKSILERWPFYKAPSGYRLIDMDFKICFDERDGLIRNWDGCFNEIIEFLASENRIKDKKIKVLVDTVRNTPDLPENGKNAAIFWALHGYFVPTKLIVDKTDNKKTTKRYTIRDSQESFVFVAKSLQEVEDHLLHIKSVKPSIQPFIYCVGEDILNIKDITVYFDDIRYNFKNFVRAVDICFKTIYLFNLDFPQECCTFYSFIESFFYKLNSKNLTSKIHIVSDYLNTNVGVQL